MVHTDINEAMLRVGRDRLINEGVVLPTLVVTPKAAVPRRAFRCGERGLWPAQHDPQGPGHCRDVPRAQARRQAAGAGIFQAWPTWEKVYDWYSFKVLPQLGKLVAGDDASYRYLAESIRMHPGQEELAKAHAKMVLGMDYHNMTGNCRPPCWNKLR